MRSTDCSIRGERVCDLSHRIDRNGDLNLGGRGECIIDGCTQGSCPREATCVQVYGTEFLGTACDPELEDRPQPYSDALADRFAACNASPANLSYEAGQPVACNDCSNSEVCLPEGLCADLLSARISCRKRCRGDGNCRTGYECRPTGSNGVYPVATPEFPFGDDPVKICMPRRPE